MDMNALRISLSLVDLAVAGSVADGHPGRATDLLGDSAGELALHLGGDLATLGPAVEAGQPNQRKALTPATRSCSQHRRLSQSVEHTGWLDLKLVGDFWHPRAGSSELRGRVHDCRPRRVRPPPPAIFRASSAPSMSARRLACSSALSRRYPDDPPCVG